MNTHLSQTCNQLLSQTFVLVCIREGVHSTKVMQNFHPPRYVEK